MKLSPLLTLGVLAGVASALLLSHASAATYVISPATEFSRGWYNDVGETSSEFGIGYYGAGREGEEYRNFFIFSLPELAPGETITSATLLLYCNPEGANGYGIGYHSEDATETFALFSLDTTSIAALRAGSGSRASTFADLGDGTAYCAGAVLSAASQGSDLAIPLNADFLAYSAANLGGEVALGGAVTSLRAEAERIYGENVFGGPASLQTSRLEVTTVPEPSSIVLITAASGLLLRRRRVR